MKILITGANGFLGHYLTEQLLAKKRYTVLATGKGTCRLPFAQYKNFQYLAMDFTDPATVKKIFERNKPGIVVHAGAISKPDDCELDQPMAYKINVEGTLSLLSNAAVNKSDFIFISTDFIFDGEQGMYKEDDLANPVNYYGTTKAIAEEAVKKYEHNWSIVRTVLVYGKPLTGRGNILSVVKEKLEKGEEYQVVNDQVRTPTYVEDLAAGIVSLIEKKATGVFHLSGEDVLTPYEMAIHTAKFLGLDAAVIKKATAADFSQPARRPLKTGFIIDKAKKELGYKPVSFAEGLSRTFGKK